MNLIAPILGSLVLGPLTCAVMYCMMISFPGALHDVAGAIVAGVCLLAGELAICTYLVVRKVCALIDAVEDGKSGGNKE